MTLEVSDDGRGFTSAQQLAALRDGHIGLASSRERVEASGGRFEIESAPGAGTRVRCALPAALGASSPDAIASRGRAELHGSGSIRIGSADRETADRETESAAQL